MGNISGFIIAMVIFSGLVIGTSTFYADMASNYGKNATSLGFLDKSGEIQSGLGAIKNQTEQPLSPLNFGGFIILGTWEALKLSASSINIFTGIVGATANQTAFAESGVVPIPAWFPIMIIGIIMVLVIFTLIAAGLKARV